MKFTPIIKLTEDEIKYFWGNVDIVTNEKCWLWKHSTNLQGYGQIKFRQIKYGSHRIAWSLFNKKDPGILNVCHTCDNPRCCNPHHLFLGSNSENRLDAIRKGRIPSNHGEKHGMSKLTDSQIKEIRNLHDLGYAQYSIAHKFNIHQSTVSRIISRKRWSHI